jgi:hypothetical protein
MVTWMKFVDIATLAVASGVLAMTLAWWLQLRREARTEKLIRRITGPWL